MAERDEALRAVADRMDVLALFEPKDRSWEEIYKQVRREVGQMIGAPATEERQERDG